MDLTPLDVRKKKEDLRRAVRGYDTSQVDTFLDLVADRLEELVHSEARLVEQVDLLRERLAAFQERERALNEALVSAQELREEARAAAERSAELRLREAETEAQAISGRAAAQLEQSRRSLQDLGVRRHSFLRELRSTLERFMADVEAEERRTEVDHGGDGAS